MRISEPIETLGNFWLPEAPCNKLHGKLSISERGTITLEVKGAFVGAVTVFNDIFKGKVQEIDRIVGEVAKSGFVTLEKCILRSGISQSVVNAEMAFLGVKYDNEEEASFWKFSFVVEELSKWLAISGIKVEQGASEQGFLVQTRKPDNIAISLPDEIEMEFSFHTFPSIPYIPTITEISFTQSSSISLISRIPRNVEYFSSLALKICHFLSLALGQIVSIQSIVVSPVLEPEDEGARGVLPVRLYGQFRPWVEKDPTVRLDDILFTYLDIEDRFKETIANWLENYDEEALAPAINLYFESISDNVQFLETRFLQLAQGIEILQSRTSKENTFMSKCEFGKFLKSAYRSVPEGWSKEEKDWIHSKLSSLNYLTLRERVHSVIQPFRHWFGQDEDVNEFARAIATTRNNFTHYSRGTVRRVFEGQELLTLYDKLEALFRLHLLKVIGFNDEGIDAVVQNSRSFRRKLEGDDQKEAGEGEVV